MTKAGDRIGAILATNDGVVKFLGFGTYLGEFIPDRPMGVTAWMIEADDWDEGIEKALRLYAGEFTREQLERALKRPNPKLQLDNGDVVWGAECWWGSEEEVTQQLALARAVEQVRIA